VTYADDPVILCRRGKAEEALQRLREIMGRLKLMVRSERNSPLAMAQWSRHNAAWQRQTWLPERF
jgi:hypothetical protein